MLGFFVSCTRAPQALCTAALCVSLLHLKNCSSFQYEQIHIFSHHGAFANVSPTHLISQYLSVNCLHFPNDLPSRYFCHLQIWPDLQSAHNVQVINIWLVFIAFHCRFEEACCVNQLGNVTAAAFSLEECDTEPSVFKPQGAESTMR